MATNPMQRKTRTAFLLGMVITLLIAAVVVVLLFMKIKNQQEEIETYQLTTSKVYVLNQDVTSGQVLTTAMFTLKDIATTTIPSNATNDVYTLLNNYSLCDTEGRTINVKTNSETGLVEYYYFSLKNGEEEAKTYIIYSSDGEEAENIPTSLIIGDEDIKYYYYAGDNNTNKTEITISSSAVIAKTDLKANTVITSTLITRSDEKTTDDLRQQEYNVISLPIELMTGDYVDIRLMLPDGQDFIVLSKKMVTVPVVNGAYSVDTIQMNLTEKEILYMSCAIVESYQIEGAKLYATTYTEAGVQEAAEVTYYPSEAIRQLIANDDNIVNKAIEGISDKREAIQNALDEYGDEDNVATETEDSISTTQDARKSYLQALTPTY